MHTRQFTHQMLAVAGLALTLVACSSSKSSDGDATSTTASAATSAPAPTSTPESTPATTPATPATPAPTTPPTTPSYSLYDEVPAPAVPGDHTDPFASSGVLADGVYWVNYSGGETMTPTFEVVQAFFGAECESQATAQGDVCENDYYVMGDPSREIDDLPFAPNVLLTVADQATQVSYWITPDELRTIRASSPSDGAPDDYGFSSFPFLMTVQSGQIVKFEQVWVP